ncbi:MAG: VWA domain-containing protein [Chitinispirillia bacterium]|nr:VWA domain-containing protein [Chitinispirillia bacterium]MCL2269601.1 VWA domain-containing protein [Chitinispirillia bacterium]
MTYRNPEFFWFLVLIAPMVWLYVWRERKDKVAVRFSDLSILKKLPLPPHRWLRHVLIFMRVAGFCFLVVALARPQKQHTEVEVTTEGVDIMLILDISESMKALDFRPDDRLAVAKRAIKDFVQMREHDRIGLVLFAARAFTRCPLTNDYGVLLQMIDAADYMEFSNMTAIGTAIATAANRLKDSPARSKVIILLTDGANNAGDIPPQTAARAAAELGIKVYTIGVGKKGQVPVPVEMINPVTGQRTTRTQMRESDLNEKELAEIALLTGGRFFRAQNTEELNEIYSEIDRMEKTEIKSITHVSHSEFFYLWLWIGFLILVFEMLLQNTAFRRIP